MIANTKTDLGTRPRGRVTGSGNLALLSLFDAIGAILQNAVLARLLMIQDYGMLAVVLSAGMFVFVVSDFGTGLAVTRLMALGADEERAKQFRGLWAVRLAMTGLTTLGALVFGSVIAPGVAPLLVLIMSSEIFRSIASFLTSAARGLTSVRAVLVISSSERFGTLIGSVIAVTRGWGLGGVVGAYVIARIASCAYAVVWACFEGFDLRFTLAPRSVWKECMGLAPFATLLLSDRIVFYSMPLVLAAFTSSAQVALYHAAFKIGLLPIALCSALLSAYFPAIVRDARENSGPRSVVGVYFFLCVVGTPIVTLCVAAPRDVLTVVFGSAFGGAAMALRLIGVFVVLNTAYQVSVYLLPAYGRERILLMTTSVGVGLCLSTATATARALGATGGALAVVMYAFATVVPHLIALRRVVSVDPEQRRILVEGWLAMLGGLVAGFYLSLVGMRTPLLLSAWVVVSSLGVLALLVRNRSMLLPLWWVREGGHSTTGR